MSKNKVLPLESLRGLAALSVAIFHFQIGSGSHFEFGFVKNAWLMVDFFFVLSGFVISLNYIERISTTKDLYHFQKKRFFRLYPLHLLTLTFFLLFEILKLILENNYSLDTRTPAFERNSIYALFANLFLLQNFLIPHLTFNMPSWSISAEFMTYIIFAVILIMVGKKTFFRNTIIIIICYISGMFLMLTDSTITDNIFGPLRCFFAFFLGMLTHIIYSKYFHQIRLHSSIPCFALLFLSAVIVSVFGNESEGLIRMIPILFGITILCLMVTNTETNVIKLLSNQTLVYMGTISYGIYMIHSAVWRILSNILVRIFNIEVLLVREQQVWVINPFAADFILISALVLTTILAHFSYHNFERLFTKSRE